MLRRTASALTPLLLLFCLLPGDAFALTPPEAAEPPRTLASLAWMAGHWRAETEGRVTEEGWFGPAGTVMPGLNRTVRADGRTSFEYLRIVDEGDGRLVYYAQPGGREPTAFVLDELGPRHAVFINPDHDFPTAIRYEHTSDNTLTATVLGTINGAERTLRWEFVKM